MQFHQGFPNGCPPADAESGDCTLYKAIGGSDPVVRDFESFAERKRPGIDLAACQSWGISVWTDMDSVQHALNAFHCFRSKHIISFSVKENDGLLKHTPSNRQPNHHTFWKSVAANLLDSCNIAIRGAAPQQ